MIRAALSIGFSIRVGADRLDGLMLRRGAQPGRYLRSGFVMGAGEELPAAQACLLIL